MNFALAKFEDFAYDSAKPAQRLLQTCDQIFLVLDPYRQPDAPLGKPNALRNSRLTEVCIITAQCAASDSTQPSDSALKLKPPIQTQPRRDYTFHPAHSYRSLKECQADRSSSREDR